MICVVCDGEGGWWEDDSGHIIIDPEGEGLEDCPECEWLECPHCNGVGYFGDKQ